MKQLNEKELQTKIDLFLNDRFKAYPELASVQLASHKLNVSEEFVSRVKNSIKKLGVNRVTTSQSYYQI